MNLVTLIQAALRRVALFLSLVFLALLAALTFTSCGKQDKAGLPNQSLTSEVQQGPVHLILRVDKPNPTVADQIHLTLEAIVAEDHLVELPRLGSKLDQFAVRDEQSTPPALAGGNRIHQSRTYTLEPFLPGEYRIPSLKIEYWKKNDPSTNKQEIVTEEISLAVRSLLNGDSAKIREITPPLALPRSSKHWWWILGIGLALLGLASFLWRRRRKSAGTVPKPALPPHLLALRALDQLLADDLIQKGEVKRYYQRITDILRRYIENRFGLAAPEQTTREFLVALSTTQILQTHHKQLLHQFLRHCDLVKFAEHQPSPQDVSNTMESCRAFITETGVDPVSVSAPTPKNPPHA